MSLTKKYPILGSSVDPEKLSLTIKSVLLGIVPYVSILNGWFGTNFDKEGLEALSESIPSLILGIWAIASTAGFVWGILRKFFNR